MSRLWKRIDEWKVSREAKTGIFLFLNSLVWSVIGFALWAFVSRFAFSTWDWALCFAGYSGFFIGYIGGSIFLCRQ